MELVEHLVVEVGQQRLDRDVVDGARTPERRLRHLDPAAQLVALEADLVDLDRAQRGVGRGTVGIGQRARLLAAARGGLGDTLGDVGGKGTRDGLFHQAQAVEGVAGIGDRALAIGLPAIVLDIGAGQRGATQQDGDLETLTAHLLQVLAHDHGRLDQEAGHADGVGLVLGRGVEDVGSAAA